MRQTEQNSSRFLLTYQNRRTGAEHKVVCGEGRIDELHAKMIRQGHLANVVPLDLIDEGL